MPPLPPGRIAARVDADIDPYSAVAISAARKSRISQIDLYFSEKLW